MKAITVCVEYDDLLAITLPRNAKYFSDIVVVTTLNDFRTQRVVADVHNARCFLTELFFYDGAKFNKGLALEHGFDVLGRDGWICVFDPDTLFPSNMQLPELQIGHLYSPKRRILSDPKSWREDLDWNTCEIYEEREYAGYFQLFHADDLILRDKPWYGIRSPDASWCDSEFEYKWPDHLKHRTDFEVLHLGQPGMNWCRRITPRLDGGEIDNLGNRIADYTERKRDGLRNNPAWQQYQEERRRVQRMVNG